MKENVQVEEELSLADIFRTLLSKLKLLIVVLLVGIVVGGTLGAILTMNTHYYGTQIQFYINPKEKESGASESTYGVYGAYGRNVMDNMVKLLESDIFTEQLMLNGAELPEKGLDATLDEKIDAANAKMAALDQPADAVADAKAVYEEKDDAFDAIWAEYTKEHGTVSFDEKDCLNYAYGISVKEAYEQRSKANNDVEEAKASYSVALAEYEKAKKEALLFWRSMDVYKNEHDLVSESVTYSYLADQDDYSDAANLARSFIYVEVSVLGDEAFAKELLEVLREQVAAYITQKMVVPSGYVGTSCEETTTRSEITLTNEGYMTRSAITYGLLAGFISLVIAAVIVIMIDRSDKRLRDSETITRRMNIPVLGVVPTIDESVLNEWKHLNDEKGENA